MKDKFSFKYFLFIYKFLTTLSFCQALRV